MFDGAGLTHHKSKLRVSIAWQNAHLLHPSGDISLGMLLDNLAIHNPMEHNAEIERLPTNGFQLPPQED